MILQALVSSQFLWGWSMGAGGPSGGSGAAAVQLDLPEL